MARKSRSNHLVSQINVVPYIDVMLVLLVIFMITAPLQSQKIEVDLPQTAIDRTQLFKGNDPIIVTVNKHGQYFIEQGEQTKMTVSPKLLATRIAAHLVLAKQMKTSPPQILLQADRDARYDLVMQAVAMIKQAGVEHVGLITQEGHHAT